MLPPPVQIAWKRYFFGAKKRTWKGIESAARSMHRSASFDSQVLKVAPEREIMAAANAILLALPQISGPTWRDRKKREQEWAQIDFCPLCWRLAPSGASTDRRPPLCEKHKPRTAEYQRHSRLKSGLPTALTNAKKALRVAGGIEAVGADLPPEILKALPHVTHHAAAADIDPTDLNALLRLLLQDVEDSPDKKIESIVQEWAQGGEWAAGTLIHAEAWLALAAKRKHGGKRPGAGRPRKRAG
jgi:hypothetical protein